ncbi:MAG: hypothetical protein Kow0067_19370 [Coriobacteriia bacterium]
MRPVLERPEAGSAGEGAEGGGAGGICGVGGRVGPSVSLIQRSFVVRAPIEDTGCRAVLPSAYHARTPRRASMTGTGIVCRPPCRDACCEEV